MAAIPSIEITNFHPTAGTVFTWTAGATGGDTISGTRRMMLFARNTSSGSKTGTVTSQPDKLGRLGHITAQSLAAGAMYYGLFESTGWLDAAGKINVAVNATDVQWALVNLPKS